ncbi:MAG: SCO family protein [Caldilineaceae bacterium]
MRAPCPQTGAAMRQIQQRLQSVDTGGIPIQLVTISFDPARDTPERLTEYAEQVDADLRNWRFVTGATDQLKSVIGGGFGVYYAPEEAANGAAPDVQFKFEPTFVLVDGLGILRAEYRTATPEAEMVARCRTAGHRGTQQPRRRALCL